MTCKLLKAFRLRSTKIRWWPSWGSLAAESRPLFNWWNAFMTLPMARCFTTRPTSSSWIIRGITRNSWPLFNKSQFYSQGPSEKTFFMESISKVFPKSKFKRDLSMRVPKQTVLNSSKIKSFSQTLSKVLLASGVFVFQAVRSNVSLSQEPWSANLAFCCLTKPQVLWTQKARRKYKQL